MKKKPEDLALQSGNFGISNLIHDERKRRKFVTWNNYHIEYCSYKIIIYSKCYPIENIKFPQPVVGWNEAFKLSKKYYYDEIFFNLHMYIASEADSRECSKNSERFANKCNRTYEILSVLVYHIKEYVDVNIKALLK